MKSLLGPNVAAQLLLLSVISVGGSVGAECTSTVEQLRQENGPCRKEASQPSDRWIPQDAHPCTIRRMTVDDVYTEFGRGGVPPLHTEPVVVTAQPEHNERIRQMTAMNEIVGNFPKGFEVTLSSSNSFSEHRRTVPLQQYIQDQVTSETHPSMLSNETWYLFGETYSPEWKQLLQNYELPPCVACERDSVALSFGIGNRGSGVQWHVHGAGFSEALHGRKHWVLYKKRPSFHPDYTSRHWMEYNYTSMDTQQRPLECTLHPGEMVYFPDMYWHATINLDPYTAFVSTFTQEHLYDRLEL